MSGKVRHMMASFCMLTALTACSSNSPFAPKPLGMEIKAPPGPPDFQIGWEQGCRTGLSTMNYDYYKTFYRFEQDPVMAQKDEYYRAWKDGYTFCRQYSFKWTTWSWDEPENTDPNRDAFGGVDGLFIGK